MRGEPRNMGHGVEEQACLRPAGGGAYPPRHPSMTYHQIHAVMSRSIWHFVQLSQRSSERATWDRRGLGRWAGPAGVPGRYLTDHGRVTYGTDGAVPLARPD